MNNYLKSSIYYVFYRKSNGTFIYNDKSLLKEMVRIRAPRFCWVADPFVFEIDSKTFLFAEVYNKFTNLGRISYREISSGNKKWHCLLKSPVDHFSFPNIFLKDGIIHLIPETLSQRKIIDYHLFYSKGTFTIKYQRVILSNVSAVDTIVNFCDRPYLLTSNFFENSDKSSILIYQINEDFSFVKGCFNISDSHNVFRPGGNFFKLDDKFVFPSQKCTYFYGESLSLCCFDNLNKTFFFHINPFLEASDIQKYLGLTCVGVHTYNKSANFEVIDIKKKQFDIISLFGKVILLVRLIKKRMMNG